MHQQQEHCSRAGTTYWAPGHQAQHQELCTHFLYPSAQQPGECYHTRLTNAHLTAETESPSKSNGRAKVQTRLIFFLPIMPLPCHMIRFIPNSQGHFLCCLAGWRRHQSHFSLWLRCANTKSSCMNLLQADLCLLPLPRPSWSVLPKKPGQCQDQEGKGNWWPPSLGSHTPDWPRSSSRGPWTKRTKWAQGAVTSAVPKRPERGRPGLTTTLRTPDLGETCREEAQGLRRHFPSA